MTPSDNIYHAGANCSHWSIFIPLWGKWLESRGVEGMFKWVCYRKWGPAARCSKANKEARLVERKVCFILEAGSWGAGGGLVSKGRLPTTDSWWARAFYRWKEGPPGRSSTASSVSHLEIGPAVIWSASPWLFQVQLGFSSRVSLFPLPWGQFSELWQLMSWLQSGHHVVNFFHLVGVTVSTRQLTGYGSEYDL